jgi:hypothetical protein
MMRINRWRALPVPLLTVVLTLWIVSPTPLVQSQLNPLAANTAGRPHPHIIIIITTITRRLVCLSSPSLLSTLCCVVLLLMSGFTETVWGGGVSGVTPGSINGPVGVASLSSAGVTGWMGQSFYDWSTSTHYLTDSGHTGQVKAFNPSSSTGLTTFYSSTNTSTLIKAVGGDGNGTVYWVDVGRGIVSQRCINRTTRLWSSASTLINYPFKSSAVAVSLLYDTTTTGGGVLYFTDTTVIIRVVINSSLSCSAPPSTPLPLSRVGPTMTSVSNLTWSSDHRSIYFLDNGAVKQITLDTYTVTTLAPSTSFVHPTALTLLLDGQSLLIADLQSSGYSLLVRLFLLNSSTTIYASNVLQSSCSANQSYQSGTLSTSCWGVIHCMYLGSGTSSGLIHVHEVNTGRIKVIEWLTGRVWVLIGGGAANDGFTLPELIPSGWASGVGWQSSFEHTVTAIVFDPTGTIGYVAEPVSPTSPHCPPPPCLNMTGLC